MSQETKKQQLDEMGEADVNRCREMIVLGEFDMAIAYAHSCGKVNAHREQKELLENAFRAEV